MLSDNKIDVTNKLPPEHMKSIYPRVDGTDETMCVGKFKIFDGSVAKFLAVIAT